MNGNDILQILGCLITNCGEFHYDFKVVEDSKIFIDITVWTWEHPTYGGEYDYSVEECPPTKNLSCGDGIEKKWGIIKIDADVIKDIILNLSWLEKKKLRRFLHKRLQNFIGIDLDKELVKTNKSKIPPLRVHPDWKDYQ